MATRGTRRLPDPGGGPSIIVPNLWRPGDDPGHLLRDEDRALLAVIATVSRYKKGETIYREGDRAHAVFNIITGVVKSLKFLAGGKEHVVGFLFPNDLLGLAENGAYMNSAEAATAVTAYRIPIAVLERQLRQNAKLNFQIIAKLCHEIRGAQQHAFLLSRRRAITKIGLFIQFLERQQSNQQEMTEEIYLPMSRTDIAAYVGISPEAVTRSFSDLVNRGAIAFRNRQHFKIIDRDRLAAAIAENRASAYPTPDAG